MAEKSVVDFKDTCALGPEAIEAKCVTVGVGKAKGSFTKLFVLAIFAGMFISFGGVFFSVVMADAQLSFAAKKILGGLVFCVGLALVLTCGAELFTGNTLMIQAVCEKKITVGEMLRNWGIVFLGNLIGSLLIVFLVVFARLADLAPDHALGNAMVGVAAGKTGLPWLTIMFRGILCNMLVCLAVWVGFAGKTVTDKIVGLILPITAFVACGFEHVVANMFFLPYGLVLKSMGYGAADAVVTFSGVLYNLSGAFIGNVIGGSFIIGLLYYVALHKRAE